MAWIIALFMLFGVVVQNSSPAQPVEPALHAYQLAVAERDGGNR